MYTDLTSGMCKQVTSSAVSMHAHICAVLIKCRLRIITIRIINKELYINISD